MGIREKIFEEFFNKLKEDKEISPSIIKELGDLLKSEETISQEKFLEAIKRGCEDVNDD